MAELSEADSATVGTLIQEVSSGLLEKHAPPQVKRDAHPKMHGCVQAEFIVGDLQDSNLRHGVFKEPRTYRAWVRFSNAFGFEHDLKAGPRGMAIKLLDVGDHRDEGDKERSTQDFLTATHDAFFLPNPSEYVQFEQAVKRGSLAVAWFFLSRFRRWRGGWALMRSAQVPARNPLAIRYFSQTPYQLGQTVRVKFRLEPEITPELRKALRGGFGFLLKKLAASTLINLSKVKLAGLLARQTKIRSTPQGADEFCDRYIAPRDLLRHAMMAFLAGHDAVFHLSVQRYVDEQVTPLDDATRRWRERHAPFTRVATLRIPRQVFWPESGMPGDVRIATEVMMDLGENMSFNPWHCLPEHTPLGAINLARRRVYPAIVTLRRTQNGVPAEIVRMQVEAYGPIRDVVQAAAPRARVSADAISAAPP